jgi:Fe-Mn family superoxide dismutase
MAFELPKLPYAIDALAPHMSAETLEFHHGKHHKTYVDKLNGLVEGKDLATKSLIEVTRAAKAANDKPLFNNAAQAWNHEFFWNCLTPTKAAPDATLQAAIDKAFGSTEALLKKLTDEAVGHFGSGWAWLVAEGGSLSVRSYHDADSPIAYQGVKPLLTVDVWEHAYYIDYRNARPKFVETVLNNLVNWKWVGQQLAAA